MVNYIRIEFEVNVLLSLKSLAYTYISFVSFMCINWVMVFFFFFFGSFLLFLLRIVYFVRVCTKDTLVLLNILNYTGGGGDLIRLNEKLHWFLFNVFSFFHVHSFYHILSCIYRYIFYWNIF